MKLSLRFLLLYFVFISCKKQNPPPQNNLPVDVLQRSNLAYGTAARQNMDVYFVANRSDTTPLTVLIHGGGWATGDKADLTAIGSYFVSQGINVVNINYRLTDTSAGSVRAADLLADVGKAVTMIHDSAAGWHVRSSGYILYGFSAGAHLALLYSYAYDQSNLTAAAIGLGTPTKFDDPNWQLNPYFFVAAEDLPPLTGEPFNSPAANQKLIALSPFYQSHFKPTFLIHGEKDQVVPFSQSQLMFDKLNQSGTPASFLPLPNGAHDGNGASQADIDSAYTKSTGWIRAYSR